jgi:hypothetical protein
VLPVVTTRLFMLVRPVLVALWVGPKVVTIV